MSEPASQTSAASAAAEGRPSEGQALAQSLAESAAKRGKSRNIGALRRLAPFVAAHWGRAAASLVFLLLKDSGFLSPRHWRFVKEPHGMLKLVGDLDVLLL